MMQPTHITRRNLLRLGTLAATGSLMTRFQPAMAGPFTGADFEKLVPADKKLSAAWIRALFERGEPEWFGGDDLKHIGMPVGGICCGQVYLSGDGRLWHWDIFNRNMAPAKRASGPHWGVQKRSLGSCGISCGTQSMISDSVDCLPITMPLKPGARANFRKC